MNKLPRIVAFLLACSLFASCSLLHAVRGKKKKRNDTTTVAGVTDTTRPVIVLPKQDSVRKPELSAETKQLIEEIKPMWVRRTAYKTFSGKAKMHFDGPDQKQEFTAHIRMQKDSLIWVNITALGGVVQAARILVTPDSFFMINYQDQEVTKIALAQAARILPTRVDFASLQNFIIGDPLRGGDIADIKAVGDSLFLQVEDTAYVQYVTYLKSFGVMIAANMTTSASGGPQARTQYSAYNTIDNRKISTFRVLDIKKGADSYSIDMNFQKIDFDQPQEFPFSIPAKYTIKH